MLFKIKCEIPSVPYIAFITKLTPAKRFKINCQGTYIIQQKIHILMVDFNLPKQIGQSTGLNFPNSKVESIPGIMWEKIAVLRKININPKQKKYLTL